MTQPPNELSQDRRIRALSTALRTQRIAVLHQDGEGYFDLAENLPPEWPLPLPLGETGLDLLPPDIADRFREMRQMCLASGEQQSFDFELAGTSRRRQFQAVFIPDYPGTTIVLHDITDARQRDTAVTALLREVSHRSKNLLAIVQSVAMQTAHHSGGIQDFLDKFRGRLHALSSTQDLVTESNWRGTQFQTLTVSQLTRVSSAMLSNVRITGENPLLGPNASLHIGLAIHELAANSVLHGAAAEGQAGQIRIDAHIEKAPNLPDQLIIEWLETGIDASKSREAPRFGTMVLERIVPLSVGGSSNYTFDDQSVSYRLAVPHDQFES